MAVNILQAVRTWQPSGLALLQNMYCLLSTANKKFENFQTMTGNLGTSVGMRLPYRLTAAEGLIAVDQGITQRLHTLTVDQSSNTAVTVTNPEQIFNFEENDELDRVGESAIAALGTKVEKNIALNAISQVPVMIPDPSNPAKWIPSGALHTESGPFRFYGDGVTPINSYQQLRQSIANFNEIGSGAASSYKFYIPSVVVPTIIGQGLAQFVPRRNDETAMSWEIGRYGSPSVEYFESNLLPEHTAGDIGETYKSGTPANSVLTVVSTNDPTGQNVTQITCTCTAPMADKPNAIRSGDLCYFLDTAGYAFPRALTFVGNYSTSQPVQMRVTANAASSGTTVVLNIVAADEGRGLTWAASPFQNCSTPIVAGMTIQMMPSHRAGLLVIDNALFVAMPQLPDLHPFETANERDTDSGASIRMSYSTIPGQNIQRLIWDEIHASTLVPSFCQRYLFPV